MSTEFESPVKPLKGEVKTWLSMIPLFFFACRGILFFQASGGNSSAGTGFGSIAASKGGGEVEVLGTVFLCVTILLGTRILSIVALCWRNKLFLGLAVYALASTAWSQFPSLSFQFGIYIVLDLLFVFYLYSSLRSRELMRIFVMLGWIVVLGSIFFSVALPKYGVDHRASTSGAWQGIFVFKNTCSIMATFLLSAIFYLPAASNREQIQRATYVFLAIFLVLMTRARTGWIVMAALLAYVGITEIVGRFRKEERVAVIVAIATISAISVAGGAVYYREILLFLGKDPTLTGRTGIWKLVLISISKRPFLGYGYRAFWHGIIGESTNITLMEQWTVPGAHNGLLEVWLDLGLVGLSVALWTLVRALRNGAICLKHNASAQVKWYLSIIVMTVVANVAEMTIMYPNYLTWMMYVLACVGLADEARKTRLKQTLA